MTKKQASNIYRSCLSSLGKGFPQWRADPHNDDEMHIGDVGYIDIEEGKFHKIMSIDLKKIRGGVVVKKEIDSNHMFMSQSVQASELSVDAQCKTLGGGVGGEAKMYYSCTSDEGAFLMLVKPDVDCAILVEDADRLSLVRMGNYMNAHYREWLEDERFESLTREEIVFITGTSKCRDWIAGVFSERTLSTEISLGVGIFNLSSISADFTQTHVARRGLELNRGHLHPVELSEEELRPEGPRSYLTCMCKKEKDFQPHRNQCIFFRAFTFKKKRFFGPSVIKAAAESQSLDDRTEEDDDDDEFFLASIEESSYSDFGMSEVSLAAYNSNASQASTASDDIILVHNGRDEPSLHSPEDSTREEAELWARGIDVLDEKTGGEATFSSQVFSSSGPSKTGTKEAEAEPPTVLTPERSVNYNVDDKERMKYVQNTGGGKLAECLGSDPLSTRSNPFKLEARSSEYPLYRDDKWKENLDGVGIPEQGNDKTSMDSWRVVVLGAAGVGKTALAVRMYDPTIEDIYSAKCLVDVKPCLIDIIDTAGQKEYSSLQDQWIREGQGFILVYSVSCRDSFDDIVSQFKAIGRVKRNPGVSMLVGNKSDVKFSDRVVSKEDGLALAAKLGCNFAETSAKTGHNIDLAFESVIRGLREVSKARSNKIVHAIEKKRVGHSCMIM